MCQNLWVLNTYRCTILRSFRPAKSNWQWAFHFQDDFPKWGGRTTTFKLNIKSFTNRNLVYLKPEGLKLLSSIFLCSSLHAPTGIGKSLWIFLLSSECNIPSVFRIHWV
jgi:hypothetical protein